MDNAPKVAFWMGRPIEDLSREELLEVIDALAARLSAQGREYHRTLDVLAGVKTA